MMFLADTAFAVELLALVAGTFLLVRISGQEVCCKTFGKVVAYFTIVASILAMLCTFYYTARYWEDGHFKTPHTMMRMQGMDMMDCPMMQDMMKKGMNQNAPDMPRKSSPDTSPSQNHEERHP